MAIYIELSTEAFGTRAAETKAKQNLVKNFSGVRRPLRGLEIAEDTHALMKVIKADGTEVQLYDTSSPQGSGSTLASDSYSVKPYSNFIIATLDEGRAEKAQIVETFGESFIYFFGEKARTVEFTGLLVNATNFNWKEEWWANYEKYLRGTRLVEMNARLYLYYKNILLEGYLLASSTRDAADSPNHTMFSATMVLTNYMQISSLLGVTQYDVTFNEDEYIGGESPRDLYLDTSEETISEENAEIQQAAVLETLGLLDKDIGNLLKNGDGITKVADNADR